MLRKGLCLLSILCYSASTIALTNLTFAKNEVEAYYNSGDYFKEFDNVIDRAKTNLIHQVKHNRKHAKLAIVLDVDETAISNYEDLKSIDFGGDFVQRSQLLEKGGQPAIPATLALYKLALAKKISVFFVTGRHEHLKDVTERTLHQAGYADWKNIFFKPDDENLSMIDYKVATRKKITDDGYKIIENIGDQYSDLKGGYAEAHYKLPNPLYYIP